MKYTLKISTTVPNIQTCGGKELCEIDSLKILRTVPNIQIYGGRNTEMTTLRTVPNIQIYGGKNSMKWSIEKSSKNPWCKEVW